MDISRFANTVLDQRAYQPHQGLGPLNTISIEQNQSLRHLLARAAPAEYGSRTGTQKVQANDLTTPRLTVGPFRTISIAHHNTTIGRYLA